MPFYTGPYCGSDGGHGGYWNLGAYNENTPGFFTNAVSSLAIPVGTTVVLYDGPNFDGVKLTLRSSSASPRQGRGPTCLTDFVFANKTSSFRISDGMCAVNEWGYLVCKGQGFNGGLCVI